ncbi:dienelactone hydrolase family protein [Nocardioides sp. TRM66260-LWL]|uniref:dienelactone hydrolase family protein n=1 Tax=Nocardioides sp. TRM66260-LWL TaxID=2874478 RepID=UPI001CC54E34|nr:dienelactone hydrolase family protein [Nocardioides sp. TRM66260-LWL]MBZ5734052.1 dienelactone hydrolase family protein [Nocardioides sp. TRM66260-LWL]
MADQNPRQNVTFPSNGNEAHGYLAVPEAGSGPGVVVIQEWWGLDDHLADVCDRLAREGFVALAPDLYGGRVAHDADEAGSFMTNLPVEQAAKDLSGAVDFLIGHDAVTSSTVGTVGFCMGGGFVLLLAVEAGDKVSAAVPFYGVGPAVPNTYQGLTAAVQGHYAEDDGFYPVEQARQQEAQIREESGAEVEFFYYPAGHAFLNDHDKMGTYDAEAAQQAWTRTVEFLKAKVS